MKTTWSNYRGYRFLPEIISHGAWLYHRFCLSLRDVEELLAERGVTVTYETTEVERSWLGRGSPAGAAPLNGYLLMAERDWRARAESAELIS